MKQAKFKIGDKCLFKNGTTLTVDAIAFEVTNSDGSGEYKYNSGYWESELELYTEPKPKKLFAFRSSYSGLIYFNDKDKKYGDNDTKAPEYDINYSDKE